MAAGGPDVAITDLGAVLDHVHERHPVPPPQSQFLSEPREDLPGLRLGTVPTLVRPGDDLLRGQPRLLLGLVEVSLERQCAGLSLSGCHGGLPDSSGLAWIGAEGDVYQAAPF